MKNVDINKMNIVELSANEYKCLLTTNNVPCFYECDFLELNAKKVDKIHYLLGRDSKDRILFAIGEKDREWKAPFSAPFSNLVLLKDDVSVAQIWEFVIELIKFAESKAAKKIEIYPPSEIYESHITARFINALLGNGFRLLHEDINYYFDLSLLDIDTYGQKLCRMGRKNLKIALRSNLSFMLCHTSEEKEAAYDVIHANRTFRGFPLRMSKDQVLSTLELVKHDCFLVFHSNTIIASAIVYRVTDEIAQVVYWGNIPGIEEYKPINYLAYQLIQYYKKLEFRILDIGISTEEGIPNFGLCTFKESIGCTASSKPKFLKEFVY